MNKLEKEIKYLNNVKKTINDMFLHISVFAIEYFLKYSLKYFVFKQKNT